MTLPIAMTRPAPDGASPGAGESPVAHRESGTVFRRALASAMNGEAGGARASRERAAPRTTRAADEQRPVDDGRPHAMPADPTPADPTPADPTPADPTPAAGAMPDDSPVHALPIELADEVRTMFGGAPTNPGDGAARGDEDAVAGADRSFVEQSLEEVLTVPPTPAPDGRAPDVAVNGAALAVSPAASFGETSGASPEHTGPSDRANRAPSHARIAELVDRDATRRATESLRAGRAREAARNLDGLVPDMRTRLERVIERMESEYGYSVDVVETSRSQARQDALFAQGRSRPGPVVTWTRNSLHLEGRAADVVIDGGYDNAAGFERLARVAREEGLRTLWPRDPGHIELTGAPGRRGTPAAATSAAAVTAAATLPAPDVEGHALGTGPDASPVAIPRPLRAGVDPAAGRLAAPRVVTPTNDPVQDALPGAVARPATTDAPRVTEPTGAVARREGRSGVLPRAPQVRADASAGLDGRGPIQPLAEGGASSVTTAAAGGAGGPGGMARVAHVATVASVADVARVATVARVAEVAVPGQSSAPAGPPPLMPGQVIAGQGAAAGGSGFASDRGAGRERGDAPRDGRDDGGMHALPVSPRAEGVERLPMDVAREILATTRTSGDAGSGDGSPVAGLARSDATERIARVLRLQDAGSERPLSSVLLRLENPEGGEDRIRIDMRGRTIGATLDVADARAAEQLRAHVPELQEALQRQGLEGEGLVVRSASRNSDVATLTASAASAERDLARAASATASDGGGSTARDPRNPPRAPHERHEREGMDQQRSRQRRDGKEGRQ